ncbi:ROK family transcriptional regulator [Persicobacter diffluens]|uniref:Transcriptional regulator n=1 Tax=Persicobacter diffluens TaxID=981 RepID=A0AAN5ALL7_9BACT|nr:transcriptional regulator [Persicobacter diffluens]
MNKYSIEPSHKKILQVISSEEDCTIPQIAKALTISVPTAQKLTQEIIDAGIIYNAGKVQKGEGRPANVYRVLDYSLQVIAVEILMKHFRIAVVDLNGNITHYQDIPAFELRDDEECLNFIVRQIVDFAKCHHIRPVGIGISITGRVNINVGRSQSFFSNAPKSISDLLGEHLDLPVVLTNDTMSYGWYEKLIGHLVGVDHAFYVNWSRGLGLSMFSNGHMLQGGNGFAGEFGHMQIGKTTRPCICGMRNCLGSELSGHAIERDFQDLMATFQDNPYGDEVTYHQVVELALGGDVNAIEVLRHASRRLGEEIGNLLSLMNPEVVVISGTLYKAKEIIFDEILKGASEKALPESFKSCSFRIIPWEPEYGLKGVAMYFYRMFEFI